MRESRGRNAAIAFGTACLVAAFMFTGSAGASSQTYFDLAAPAAQGYDFSLYGTVKPGSARAAVAGFGARDDSAVTFYAARKAARATRSRVHARLPGLGRVSVRFDERKRKDSSVKLGHGCRLVFVSRFGVFRGDLDMHGDGGYAGVDRKRATGGYTRFGIKGCHGQHRRPAPATSAVRQRPDPEALLTSCGPGPRVSFGAVASSRESAFAASSREREHGLSILRYASAEGKGRAMQFSPQLKTARVIPPGPHFDGSARFESGDLTGDLTASFIGVDDVPLTPGDAELQPFKEFGMDLRCMPLFADGPAPPEAAAPGVGVPADPARGLARQIPFPGPGLPFR